MRRTVVEGFRINFDRLEIFNVRLNPDTRVFLAFRLHQKNARRGRDRTRVLKPSSPKPYN